MQSIDYAYFFQRRNSSQKPITAKEVDKSGLITSDAGVLKSLFSIVFIMGLAMKIVAMMKMRMSAVVYDNLNPDVYDKQLTTMTTIFVMHNTHNLSMSQVFPFRLDPHKNSVYDIKTKQTKLKSKTSFTLTDL